MRPIRFKERAIRDQPTVLMILSATQDCHGFNGVFGIVEVVDNVAF